MSRGKYSVKAYINKPKGFNAKGQEPIPYDASSTDPEHYVLSASHFDDEGYDGYGYSCYDKDGKYAGDGEGVDRAGWTEMDYVMLQDIPEEHRDSYYFYN